MALRKLTLDFIIRSNEQTESMQYETTETLEQFFYYLENYVCNIDQRSHLVQFFDTQIFFLAVKITCPEVVHITFRQI